MRAVYIINVQRSRNHWKWSPAFGLGRDAIRSIVAEIIPVFVAEAPSCNALL